MNFSKLITMLIAVIAMLIPNFKKADSKMGVKEINDLLLAMNATTLFMVLRLKDGIGFDDAAAFIAHVTTNDEFKALMKEAYDKYELVKPQIEDMDIGEGLSLLNTELAFIPQLLDSLKK